MSSQPVSQMKHASSSRPQPVVGAWIVRVEVFLAHRVMSFGSGLVRSSMTASLVLNLTGVQDGRPRSQEDMIVVIVFVVVGRRVLMTEVRSLGFLGLEETAAFSIP